MIALLAMTLLVVFLYALTPSLRWEDGQLHVSGHVRRHLAVLAGVLLVCWRGVTAWTRSASCGKARDHSARCRRWIIGSGIPANLTLAMLAIASAMLVAWTAWIGQTRVAFVTITVMLLAALTVRQVLPAVGDRFVTAIGSGSGGAVVSRDPQRLFAPRVRGGRDRARDAR